MSTAGEYTYALLVECLVCGADRDEYCLPTGDCDTPHDEDTDGVRRLPHPERVTAGENHAEAAWLAATTDVDDASGRLVAAAVQGMRLS